MLIALTMIDSIAIASAIVALVFARSAAIACRSAASEARLISSICSELEASMRCSASRSLSDTHLEAADTNAEGISP
jgi:hypothetical protein